MTTDQTGPGWNLVFASVGGPAHRDGSCQDYSDGCVIATPDGPVVVAAVADGAGSASHSEQGARIAVAAVLTAAADELAVTAGDHLSDKQIRNWVDAARHRVEAEATTRGIALRRFACTLLVAVVGPTSVWAAQIGDGLIVYDGIEPGMYAFAFWPDSGEYVNTTRFLTDADYKTRLRTDRLSRPTTHLALLTDGLQMLALDYATALVHVPFFAPMFTAVAASMDGTALQENLLTFLSSSRINERTDDDKTLVLASLRPLS